MSAATQRRKMTGWADLDGHASVEMSLWDPSAGTLVAYATQVMFFAFGAFS